MTSDLYLYLIGVVVISLITNFIVNKGNATSEDVLELMLKMQNAALFFFSKYNQWLKLIQIIVSGLSG